MTSASVRSITILRVGPDYSFAAKELASYINKITGTKPLIVSKVKDIARYGSVFIVGHPDAGPVSQMLDGKLTQKISKAIAPTDAFVVWPVTRGNKRCFVLAGANPVTTLYAVYTYLEKFCHVGFFQDGEYVPKTKLPFSGVPLVRVPRFLDRKGPLNIGAGHWGLKKFYQQFWTKEDIKRELRWMAKRRMNIQSAAMQMQNGSTLILAREVCKELGYPIGKPKEEEAYVSGFSIAWTWPPEFRTEMIRECIEYGRKLGIRFIYGLRFGEVPREFKAKYPQFKYVKVEGTRWEHPQLHPDDPLCKEFTSRYTRKINETFGTDHLYAGFPYCETSREKTPAENYELKKNASLQFMELLQEIDPRAVWMASSWDFFWSRDTWTQTRVKRFLNVLPDDAFYICDTNADNLGVPVYQEHRNFHGKNWAFGIMHSAAGLDQIHGDFHNVLDRLKEIASDPKAAHCRGVFLLPELTHYNMMYYDFLTHAAWDPSGIELNDFLDDFALRRYGRKSICAMRRVIDDIVAALYTREVNTPVYNLVIIKWLWHNIPTHIQRHTIPLLYRALKAALKEHPKQLDNPLYENDMISYSKAFLAEIAAFHFHRANDAYAARNIEALRSEAAKCLANVEWIGRVLSTRPDYSIAKMIRNVMKVPGTNCHTPRMVLNGTVNWDYCSNDSYEQVANYDLPRMSDYFKRLEDKIHAGCPPIDMWRTIDDLSPTHDNWVDGEATLKRRVVYHGNTIRAIVDAIDACTAELPKDVLKGAAIRRGKKVGWRVDFSKSGQWETSRKGACIKGNLISSDAVSTPLGSYMYKEWVDMPFWGTVRSSKSSGLGDVDLHKTPLLTIRCVIEKGRDPVHLWAKWKGASGKTYRTRIWRSLAVQGKWITDTIDLLHAIRSHGEEPKKLISLEFATQRPPYQIRVKFLEITS